MLRGSWESRSRSTRLEPMKPAEPVMRRDWGVLGIKNYNAIGLS